MATRGKRFGPPPTKPWARALPEDMDIDQRNDGARDGAEQAEHEDRVADARPRRARQQHEEQARGRQRQEVEGIGGVAQVVRGHREDGREHEEDHKKGEHRRLAGEPGPAALPQGRRREADEGQHGHDAREAADGRREDEQGDERDPEERIHKRRDGQPHGRHPRQDQTTALRLAQASACGHRPACPLRRPC